MDIKYKSSTAIQYIIDDNSELFSLPDIVIKLNELLNSPNSSINDFAELICLDAGLTIQLLKIVNSSYYNLPKSIDTVSNAISIIGINDLSDMILATKIIKKFDNIPVDLISPQLFWKHNIACALAAKIVAKKLNIKNSERYFIIGLLHDIGKLVMYLSQPELSKHIFELLKKNEAGVEEIEKIAFGFSHDVVGAELLKKWGLPESIYIPVGYHHHPKKAKAYRFETAVLHLANSIANLIEVPFSYDDALPVKSEIWEILDVDSEILVLLTHSTENYYRDIVPLMMTS